MTPPGVHRVCEKIGSGAPAGRIFRDRIDTGEDWPIGKPEENLILSRILRLEGLEQGLNKGKGIDSYERYIYIHGTNNEDRVWPAPLAGVRVHEKRRYHSCVRLHRGGYHCLY